MDKLKEELKIENYELLSQKVYRVLKKAIVDEKIKPGTRLLEVQIAKDMKISRTPVREALRRLSAENFLHTIPNMGIFVPKISLYDLVEVLQIRKLLEGFASSLAAEKAIPKDTIQLESFLINMNSAMESDDFIGFSSYNSKFHNFIFDIAGNKKLKETYLNLIDHTHRARIRSMNVPGRLQLVVQEHDAILKGIKNNDPVKAQQASQLHVEKIIENILR